MAPDGVGIAFYDLGGTGQRVLLVHATGFCSAVLTPLAAGLGDGTHCVALDERAHGSSDRPASEDFGWQGFAADVLAVVDHMGLDKVTAFGHSCGAAALLLAEEARPGTFAALYCYEPIIYPGIVPLTPRLEGNPLASSALRRRETFPSRAEALTNFSTKAPFELLDARVLEAYVNNGFASGPEGIHLRCRRDDEAQVYAHSLAHAAYAHLDRVRCPVRLACGARTDAVGGDLLELFAARLPDNTVEVFADLGHFGPLEDPDAVARSLVTWMTDTDTPGV
jgi:pimeloyl-ACP methyl ester carboxylesterase